MHKRTACPHSLHAKGNNNSFDYKVAPRHWHVSLGPSIRVEVEAGISRKQGQWNR
jgi:hypothetical protein